MVKNTLPHLSDLMMLLFFLDRYIWQRIGVWPSVGHWYFDDIMCSNEFVVHIKEGAGLYCFYSQYRTSNRQAYNQDSRGQHYNCKHLDQHTLSLILGTGIDIQLGTISKTVAVPNTLY